MKHKDAEKIMRQYCAAHRIRLLYPDSNPGRNEGGQAGRTIWLGEFDDADCLVAAFFHEVGHIIDGRRKFCTNHRVTIFEHELRAWTYGMEEMHKFGIGTDARAIGYMMDRLSHYAAKESGTATTKHPGNAAAMRDALEAVLKNHNRMILPEICCPNCGEDFQLRGNLPPDITRKVKAALSAPARNCDCFGDIHADFSIADSPLPVVLTEASREQLLWFIRWLFDTKESKTKTMNHRKE